MLRLLLGLIPSLIRRRKAKGIADKVATVILAASGLAFFLKHDDNCLIPEDKFVRAYVYGTISCAMTRFDLQGKVETKGYVIWETFERLFPEKGAILLDSCNEELEAGDKEFKRIVAIGFAEMKQVLEALASNAGNVKTLESLRAHLVRMPFVRE